MSTGVYGALGNNGLINANFFVDRAVIPISESIEIDESGKILGSPTPEKDGDAVREVQFGLLLDINTAKIVANWLNDRIKEFEDKVKK